MYSLRKLEDKDIELVELWLKEEHVAKWFGDSSDWIEEIYGRNKDFNFIHHFIVEGENGAVGFCQYYDYWKLPEDDLEAIEPEGTYGIDYMIGEVSLRGNGIGKHIVKMICDKVCEENKNVVQIVADPTIEEKRINIPSIKVLEANCFFYDKKSKLYRKIIGGKVGL